MAGVALVGLVMLRSLVKSIPPADPVGSLEGAPTLSLNLGDTENEPTPATDAEDPGERPRLKLKKGPNLKDDLTEIVREDPDAAAAILRGWIGNAS